MYQIDCIHVPEKLQVCTSARLQRLSKFVGLDENWTKAINLPKPFVSKNGQRLYPKRKAPANLPEPSDFTPKSSRFTPYTPFLGEKSSYLGWHWQRVAN